MTEHQGDLRIVDNVVQYFTGDAWVEFRVTSLYEKGRADMLEDVIVWLRENLRRNRIEEDGSDWYLDPWELVVPEKVISDLKEAMRLQQND